MPNLPANATDNFFRAVERVTKATAQWVADNTGGLDVNAMVIFLNNLPMESLIRDTLGFDGDLAKLEATQIAMLKNFEVTAPITDAVVQALIDVNNATFMSYTGTMTETIRQSLLKAVLAGTPRNKFVNAVADLSGQTLSKGQIKTIVETALKTFSRQVNAVMSEDMPDDTLYVYVGTIKTNTRELCLAMKSAGALTKAEIMERFPGTFIDGGGFNCGHRWAVQTTLSNKFTFEGQANAMIKTQGFNPATVQTPLQIAAAGS